MRSERYDVRQGAIRQLSSDDLRERHERVATAFDVDARVSSAAVDDDVEQRAAGLDLQRCSRRGGPGAEALLQRFPRRRAFPPAQGDAGKVWHDARREPRVDFLDDPRFPAARVQIGRQHGQAVPGLLADDGRKFGVEHEAVRRRGVRGEVCLHVARTALLVASHEQSQRVRPFQIAEGMHREQRLDQGTFVVGGAATVDGAVANHAREGRHRPLLLVDGLHVAVHDQSEDGRTRRTGQLDLGHRTRVACGETERRRRPQQPLLLVEPRLVVAGDGGKTDRLQEQRLEVRSLGAQPGRARAGSGGEEEGSAHAAGKSNSLRQAARARSARHAIDGRGAVTARARCGPPSA